MPASRRIAIVSPFLDRRHGTERCVVEQIEHLARAYGYEIHIYSQRVEEVAGMENFCGQSERVPAAPGEERGTAPSDFVARNRGRILFHKIPQIPGPLLLRYPWWFLANQYRRRRDRAHGLTFDLVYSPGINCWDADVIVVHIVFREFRRLVREELRLWNLPLRAWPRALHRRLYYRLIIALERRIYRDPRVKLAAVSCLTASELGRHFGREDVVVIPNAVDIESFRPEQREARRNEGRRHFGYTEGDVVVLLVGNDWKKKGLDSLLEAVAECRDLPLKVLVVGRDDPAAYHADVRRLHLDGRVHFAPHSGDIMLHYAAADIYAGPSLHDSFALPPAEAMACGLPVITSASNGGCEMIESGVDGYVLRDSRDVPGLARLLRLLSSDAELRRQLGANAVRKAQRYTWAANADRTHSLLEAAFQNARRETD